MNMAALAVIEPVVLDESIESLFAPAKDDWLHRLLAQYTGARKDIEAVAEFSKKQGAMNGMTYFLRTKRIKERHLTYTLTTDDIFNKKQAIAALNADFWQMAFNETDLYEVMPEARRKEWRDIIDNHKAPEFEESTVISTIGEHMNSRSKYLAERVDGIFRNLSREHVTNQPEGFSKRMILSYMYSYGDSPNSERSGYISDLRKVIAKLMGRDEQGEHYNSYRLLSRAYREHGKWLEIDGGALRIKAYLKGTLHIDVHPELAWKLNQILSIMYPLAIPSQFRKKPAKPIKEFPLRNDLISQHAMHALGDARFDDDGRVVEFRGSYSGEIEGIMDAIGGVSVKRGFQSFRFDYDARDVIKEISFLGALPEQKSHQFYPTLPAIAKLVVDMADIQLGDKCLEPSAGIGGIADLMPKDQTECVEISELHCSVLESKGYAVMQADFLQYAPVLKPLFDKVVMNPPFAGGRAELHLKAAASVLNPDGVLVAILPASLKGKQIVDGMCHEYTDVLENCFKGTGVSVVILKLSA